MEPALGERDDACVAVRPGGIDWPQWSPLLVSGMTGIGRTVDVPAAQAAMEPALGERDDQQSYGTSSIVFAAPQWSPLLVSGMTGIDGARVGFPDCGAAMEPALGERDDRQAAPSQVRRARPQWSPLLVSGMTDSPLARLVPARRPQWSPLLA